MHERVNPRSTHYHFLSFYEVWAEFKVNHSLYELYNNWSTSTLFFYYILNMSFPGLKMKKTNQNPVIIQIRIGNPVDDFKQALKCKWPDENAFKPLKDVKLPRE